MHLAIVSPYPPSITGIGQYGFHVSQLLAQSGAFSEITVLSGSNDPPPMIASERMRINHAWQPGQLSSGPTIITQLWRIQPDLVWFNTGVSMFGRSPLANLIGLSAPYWSRRMGIPTVVTLHELVELSDLRSLNAPGGPLAPYGARLMTNIGLQADVVCLTMRRYSDWVETRKPGLPHVFIPIGAYQSPELLPQSPDPELLFFSTLAPFKGLENLLEAFVQLQEDHPRLRLTIAGAEHYRYLEYGQELRERYARLPNIRWLGQVPEEQVRDVYQAAQIVVLPYTASTGASSVLFQTASWGRPAVVSDLPETRQAAKENGLNVTFFESGNTASLVDSLRFHLDSPDIRQEQVKHNFAAIQRHRPEETCRAYLQAFNLALKLRHSSKRVNVPARAFWEWL